MAIIFPEGQQDYPGRFGNIVTKVNQTSYTISVNNTSFANATNCAVSITPRSSASQILLLISINGLCSNTAYYRVLRSGTQIGGGTGVSGSIRSVWNGSFFRVGDNNHGSSHSNYYLDSPSTTSAVTYQVQVSADTSTTFYLNRNNNGGTSPTSYRAMSTLVAIEVEAE
tara:strand:+ start:150 stop:656 length:507 start_codon:yes stop_codon:yes gene_type:complete